MKHLIFPILLLFLHHQISPSNAAGPGLPFIRETCRRATETDPLLNYDICVNSLQVDPRTTTVDIHQLGVVAIELAIANATSTVSTITDLVKNNQADEFFRQCMTDCQESYEAAIPILNDSLNAFNNKKYNDANIWISAVMDDSVDCEESFKERKGYKSPLTEQNSNLYQLTAIAIAATGLTS